MKSVRRSLFEFEKDGFQVIWCYSNLAFCNPPFPHINSAYCFEDSGTQHPIKYYGNVDDLMTEILLSRCDLLIRKRILNISSPTKLFLNSNRCMAAAFAAGCLKFSASLPLTAIRRMNVKNDQFLLY